MKYAVVRITGHQYKVSEGDEVLVDRLAEQKVEPEVLLVVDGDKVSVGKPKVSGAKVTVKVLGEEKGEKIDESHIHLTTNHIIDAMLKTCELEVPELIVEEETERIMSRLVDQAESIGLSLDQY